ncbi:MAG: hypothetical protein HOW73_24170 [Polyangiaceae bacterium]|nr:hypothetical protein [Polyangiaceae bacterium]
MSYDRADWHYEGDFPSSLPTECGGTHIGMFLAWAIHSGLEGDELREDAAAALEEVRARRMTGRDFLFNQCDGKFWESDLSEEGNEFAKWYYAPDTAYLADYERELGDGLETLYHVADTWENYDKLAKVIDQRFDEWRRRPHRV